MAAILLLIPAKAQVPQLLEYYGYLEEAQKPASGVRSIGVRLFDGPIKGKLLYSEKIGPVTFTKGDFYFQYGSKGIASAMTGRNDWLEIVIDNKPKKPRERLLSVPFALRSLDGVALEPIVTTLQNQTQGLTSGLSTVRDQSTSLTSHMKTAQTQIATLSSNVSALQAASNSTQSLPELVDLLSRSRIINLSGDLSFASIPVTLGTLNSFTISNTGFDRLTVSGIVFPPGFSGDWNGVIEPGKSKTVPVYFSPATVGSYEGVITVNSNAKQGTNVIPVRASGISYESGFVSTLAIKGDPQFGAYNIAADKAGNLYTTAGGQTEAGFLARIVKIDPNGNVTTIAGSIIGYADGQGTAARFSQLRGIAVDTSGNIYVIDKNLIRKISANGNVSTLAGGNGDPNWYGEGSADGQGGAASFRNPSGIAVDASGNLYVADWSNHRIRKISASGNVTTLAGSTQGFADGQGASAKFSFPAGVAVDASGNVFVSDRGNYRIRKVSVAGNVFTIAGGTPGHADGQWDTASFEYPDAIALDPDGNLYVSDVNYISENSYRLRKVSTSGSGSVSTLAGGAYKGYFDGPGLAAKFTALQGLAVGTDGSVYVAQGNDKIRKVSR